MGKRVSIVFEETGPVVGGGGFNVFLEGVDKERMRLPEDQLSSAEFWAMKCFLIVGDVLRQTGVAQSEKKKPESS
jgi:hypothetical protein